VPTYQYTCTDCGEPVEAVQKFSDTPLTVCAACGGRLRKVFSPVGIVFKGSGFYRTDSRNGSGSAKDKSSGDSPAKVPASESSSNGNGSNGHGSNGNGSADKSAAKKSESAGTAAKSSSSSEKVA
jgi:putative FmdB family regulatory protein